MPLLRVGEGEEREALQGSRVPPVGAPYMLPYEEFVPSGKREAPIMAYFKAIAMTLLTTYPFFQIALSLSHLNPKEFEPCTDRPCDYIRIFRDQLVPGTGGTVVRVQNGIYRPLFIDSSFTTVRTVYYIPDQKDLTEEDLVNPQPSAMDAFLDEHTDVRQALQSAVQELPDYWFAKQLVPRALQWIHILRAAYASPTLWLASRAENSTFHYQLGNIRPGRCLTASQQKWGELCDSPEARERINNFLATGKSLWIYVAGLSGWALFKILHDCLLMAGFEESLTLRLGSWSVICQIVAAIAGLAWSFGALGIFASSMDGIPTASCSWSCFYRFPAIAALLAASTPAFVLYLALSKIKAYGLSLINGDYLYHTQFDVPFRFVRQSPYWTEDTLLVQQVVGGNVGADYQEDADWKWRDMTHVTHLIALIYGYFLFLAAISGAAVLRLMELGIAAHLPLVPALTRWLPLLFICSIPVLQKMPRVKGTMRVDAFFEQFPKFAMCRVPAKIGVVILQCISVVTTISLLICLVPVSFGSTSLLQAELWVNGGFFLTLFILPLIQGRFFNTEYIKEELTCRKIIVEHGAEQMAKYKDTILA